MQVLFLAKSNSPPWVFFTFFKLCKWYQIAQSISNRQEEICKNVTSNIGKLNGLLFVPYDNLFLSFFVCVCVFLLFLCLEKKLPFFPEIGYYQHHRCRLNSLKTYMTSCTSSHNFQTVQQVKSCCRKWQTPSNFQNLEG